MKNFTLTFFLFFCSILFCSSDLNAQCTVHGVNGPSITSSNVDINTLGQSFQACQSGEITSIVFSLGSLGSGTYDLRIAAITAPPTSFLSSPVYQTFENPSTSGVKIITINLNALRYNQGINISV